MGFFYKKNLRNHDSLKKPPQNCFHEKIVMLKLTLLNFAISQKDTSLIIKVWFHEKKKKIWLTQNVEKHSIVFRRGSLEICATFVNAFVFRPQMRQDENGLFLGIVAIWQPHGGPLSVNGWKVVGICQTGLITSVKSEITKKQLSPLVILLGY